MEDSLVSVKEMLLVIRGYGLLVVVSFYCVCSKILQKIKLIYYIILYIYILYICDISKFFLLVMQGVFLVKRCLIYVQ